MSQMHTTRLGNGMHNHRGLMEKVYMVLLSQENRQTNILAFESRKSAEQYIADDNIWSINGASGWSLVIEEIMVCND